MTGTLTDRIERSIVINAPQSRVWRALTTPREFREWFGLAPDGEFTPGARLRGTIVGTNVDADVAALQGPHLGRSFEMVIELLEPERRFAYRWHPGAADPQFDYSGEPMTLVEFTLETVAEGTRVTVVESGFDALPPARRTEAFDGNREGWRIMMGILQKYASHA
jgi:uncharacterized protein YndB with AHSA1/START domain